MKRAGREHTWMGVLTNWEARAEELRPRRISVWPSILGVVVVNSHSCQPCWG